MSYSQTRSDIHGVGGLQIVLGTYNCASVTAGELKTGLGYVIAVFLQPNGTGSVLAKIAAIDETMPKSNDSITLATNTSDTGTFVAIGM